MNFTASFLSFRGSTILDELGNPISNIEYDKRIYPLKYRKPVIIYDYLETERGKVEVIKELKSISKIEKLGYSVCSVIPPREWGWGGRSRALVLIKSGTIDERYAKRLTHDIKGCIVLFDEANLKIKITGPRCGPTGEGPWLDV